MTKHHLPLTSDHSGVRPYPPNSHRDALTLLRDMAVVLQTTTEYSTVLQTALDTARALLPVDDTGLYLYNADTSRWQRTTADFHHYSALCQQIGTILEQQSDLLIIVDLTEYPSSLSQYASEFCQAAVAVPLFSANRLVGMICAIHSQPYTISAEEYTALEMLALQLGMALQRMDQTNAQAVDALSLNILLENTGDAVLLTDESGCITQVNPAARAMFCFSLDDVCCQPLCDLPFPPELHAALDAILQRPTGSQMTFDTRLADGRELAVSLASADPPTHAGTTYDKGRLVMIARDMTRLRDAERARMNFIHSAAHDLRNPLSVTLGALSMLNKELRGTGTEIQHEIIAMGLHGIERIEKLINGLLHLEHIENEAGLSQTLVDVRDLVERAVIDTRPLMDARSHTFSLEIPHELPPLNGDIHWLTRALVQVLTNAAQFTPAGGTVVLRVTTQHEAIYIEVEDSGPGIPPKDQAVIFDPFMHSSQTDSDGPGLGLAIVKAVIERHQGRVFVKSGPETGSVFGIILPTAPLPT